MKTASAPARAANSERSPKGKGVPQRPVLPDDAARVLVVDDSEEVRSTMSRILGRGGYDTVVVGSTEEALESFARETFDAVVSDIHLSGAPGTELLRELRARANGVPVILFTGKPDVQTAIAAVELQAFHYLTKPFRARELLAIVGRAVSHRRIAAIREEALRLTSSAVHDTHGLEDQFRRALDTMWFAYQPIIDANWTIVGFEALLRCEESGLRGPLEFLSAADQLGYVDELARAIREKAPAPLMARSELLFMNIDPSQLRSDAFFASDDPLVRMGSRVVLEITERASLQTILGFEEKIWKLKQTGFRIAVDDLGAGYSGLTTFAQLEPEFVKLDGALIRGVQRSERKKMVIGSMANLCLELGIHVVAEGVESQQEFEVLRSLGCTHFQGFFVGRPAPLG